MVKQSFSGDGHTFVWTVDQPMSLLVELRTTDGKVYVWDALPNDDTGRRVIIYPPLPMGVEAELTYEEA